MVDVLQGKLDEALLPEMLFPWNDSELALSEQHS